jgi:hypothetical protein
MFYYRHTGSPAVAAALFLAGWRMVGDYQSPSAVIDRGWWMRIGPCPRKATA